MLEEHHKHLQIIAYSVCAHAESLQSCLTLGNPMDWSPPRSSVHGILQARILAWVAMPSSRRIFPTQPMSPVSPALAGKFLTAEPPGNIKF